jgi:exosome complex exonuclease DIS3/RRP44
MDGCMEKDELIHFVKTLGSSGDRETETEVLLLEHDVPYQEFSKRVLEDLPVEGERWVVLDKHLNNENRRDFRDLNVCSIDPPGKFFIYKSVK